MNPSRAFPPAAIASVVPPARGRGFNEIRRIRGRSQRFGDESATDDCARGCARM
jgi:hypothetical protein